jgi:hypothetical protein
LDFSPASGVYPGNFRLQTEGLKARRNGPLVGMTVAPGCLHVSEMQAVGRIRELSLLTGCWRFMFPHTFSIIFVIL